MVNHRRKNVLLHRADAFGASKGRTLPILLTPLITLITLSPMATLGVGSFGEVEWVSQDDVATDLIGPLDDHDAHGWFTLGIGGNVDLFGQD
jgi:hypothetical protein